MSTTDRLLNRCKSVLDIESDYRLAKVLGISHTTITHWRNGRSTPSDEAVISICALMQKDPAQAIAQLHAERAKTDIARQFWQNTADKLSSALAPVISAVFVAILLVALSPTPAQAATGTTVNSYSTGLCIMLNRTSRKSVQFFTFCRLLKTFFERALFSCTQIVRKPYFPRYHLLRAPR